MIDALVGLRNFWREIVKYFHPINLTIFAALIAPYCLSIAFIVSIGGTFQQVVLSTLISEAPSLYEALYNNSITGPIQLGDWLRSALHLGPLLIGLAVSVVAIPQRTTLRVFLATVATTPIGLMILDLITLPLGDAIIIANILSNIVGGIIGGALATIGLMIFQTISKIEFPGMRMRVAIGSIAIVTWGVIVSTTAFCGYVFLYQPVSQHLEAVLAAPFGGWNLGPLNVDGKRSSSNFTILPNDTIGGSLRVDSPGGLAKIRWTPLKKERFTVNLTVALDCPQTDVKDFPISPSLTMKNVSSVNAHFLDSGSWIRTSSDPYARFDYRPDGPTSYNVRNNGKQKLDISQFASEKDKIKNLAIKRYRCHFWRELVSLRGSENHTLSQINSDSNWVKYIAHPFC